MDQLNVQENIHFTIRISEDLAETLQGITVSIPSQLPGIYQFIKVWLDSRLSNEQQMLVLVHEMIHVKQYAKSELVVEQKGLFWRGRKIYYSGEYDPETLWEKEANDIDQTLAAFVLVKQNNTRLENLLVRTNNYAKTGSISSACIH